MSPADDYDTPWKEAVTRYFPEFMAFYFERAYEEIDWQRPYVFFEQELAQIVRDAELGPRRLDKLVRVARCGGGDEWVFVHIDVQGNFDKQFAERIFTYNYRLYDRYRRPVASLAVLADGSSSWRPSSFRYSAFGCETAIRFPVVKLNDFARQLDRLLQHPNVFALVTAAHLLTQQTKGRDVQRHEAKWRLARILYERNWDRQRIIDLFNIIDWMMHIPEPLQRKLMHDINELERERKMPYINSFERVGLERGLAQGRQEGRQEGREEGRELGLKEGLQKLLIRQLEERFGPLPKPIKERLAKADRTQLEDWGVALVGAYSLESIFGQAKS